MYCGIVVTTYCDHKVDCILLTPLSNLNVELRGSRTGTSFILTMGQRLPTHTRSTTAPAAPYEKGPD